MEAKIYQLTPQARQDDIIPNTGIYIARILRLEELLKEACDTLENWDGEMVVWPKAVREWYDLNYPETVTLESILEKLDDEDIDYLVENGIPIIEYDND